MVITMKIKLLSLITAAFIFLGCSEAFAYIEYTPSIEGIPNADSKVTLIVEVEGDPVFASEKADKINLPSYRKSESRKMMQTEMLKTQAQVEEDISEILPEVRKNFVYTNILNGFSVEADIEDIEKIEKISGVKNVSVAETIPIPEPMLSSSGELTGTSYSYDELDYHGEGQVICIIDSEFDTNHDFFKDEPEDPKCSKSDIQDMIGKMGNLVKMNVTDADQVYKSAKIPLAFDYGNKDSDTSADASSAIHGTHVAGIAAGKNGTAPDGTLFSGVAPEAQLILMKISRGTVLSTDVILAALDDAAAVDEIDVINISMGSVYSYKTNTYLGYDKCFQNLRNSGKTVCVSAGNDSRGFDSNTPFAENIEYASTGSPANVPDAFTAASAINFAAWASLGRLTVNDEDISYMNVSGSVRTFDEAFGGKSINLQYCGSGAVSDFENVDLTGKVAVVLQGSESFSVRMERARAAGAEGILYILNGDYLNVRLINISGTEGDVLPGAIIRNIHKDKVINADEAAVHGISNVDEPLLNSGTISDFSSYGTTPLLDLKPDITAPGGNVYSSYPGNKYATMSGTSMSAPHMTGISALMNQYIENNFSITGKAKTTLLENLLMSSAKIIIQDNGAPYSPRVQGAGLVRADSAMETPVILKNEEGKTKISLYDKLTDNFDLKFYAENLTDKAVTYDTVKIYTMTDGYALKDGAYYVDSTVTLNSTAELPQSVTVPAKGNTEIKCSINLDSAQTAENMKIFTNGFYVDGFAVLSQSDNTLPEISIPFTGFYGDWLDAPFFDSFFADESSVTKSFGILSEYRGIKYYAGTNIYSSGSDNIVSENYIAISPNGDNRFDKLYVVPAPIRSLSDVDFILKDEQGKVLNRKNVGAKQKFDTDFVALDFAAGLEDGTYTIEIIGTHWYSDDKTQTASINFTVDTQPPEILSAYVTENQGERTFTVEARDNHYLSAVLVSGKVNGKTAVKTAAVNPETDICSDGTAEVNIDITDMDYDSIEFEAVDFALNVNHAKISDYTKALSLTNISHDSSQITGNILNLKDESVQCDVILGFYDENGRLLGLVYNNKNIPKGYSPIEFPMPQNVSGTAKISAFFWNTLLGMLPLDRRQDF